MEDERAVGWLRLDKGNGRGNANGWGSLKPEWELLVADVEFDLAVVLPDAKFEEAALGLNAELNSLGDCLILGKTFEGNPGVRRSIIVSDMASSSDLGKAGVVARLLERDVGNKAAKVDFPTWMASLEFGKGSASPSLTKSMYLAAGLSFLVGVSVLVSGRFRGVMIREGVGGLRGIKSKGEEGVHWLWASLDRLRIWVSIVLKVSSHGRPRDDVSEGGGESMVLELSKMILRASAW
jgi:hypothetical protein